MKKDVGTSILKNDRAGKPGRIQHFLKVHSFAKTIAVFEHLDEKTLFITEAAAIVHDIGIRPCLGVNLS